MQAFPILNTKAFRVFIADNRALGIHRSGYNGVAALIPEGWGNNIFVPSYAGLNYETISLTGLGAYVAVSGGFKFEPRRERMVVEAVEKDRVVLVQPETSHAHVSARITFSVEEPHYLHQRIEVTAHRRFCGEEEKNAFRSLWASYVHMPPDRHIYLKPDLDSDAFEGWIGLTREQHGSPDYQVARLPGGRDVSVAEHLTQATAQPYLAPGDLDGPIPGTADAPLHFYYGLYHDLLVLKLFKQADRFRLAYSPNGGGREPAWSPAWDYVLALDDMVVGKPYVWDLCLVVKPFKGRADVLDEVRRFKKH